MTPGSSVALPQWPVPPATPNASARTLQELGSFGLMFYNCLFSLPIIAVYVLIDSEKLAAVRTFEHWAEPGFIINYCLSCIMGYVNRHGVAADAGPGPVPLSLITSRTPCAALS